MAKKEIDKREAVWRYLNKRNITIDTFDINGEWAILYDLEGDEMDLRVNMAKALEEFKEVSQ